MNVILIKWRSRWEDYDEIIGIAATKYPDCYGDRYSTWAFEDFDLIEE